MLRDQFKRNMVLLPFKVLFLFAVFGVWNRTGNAILASGIWALASFLVSVFASGLSIATCCWSVASFLVSLAMIFGLSYIQRSFWMIPGAVVGSFILIVFFYGMPHLLKSASPQKTSGVPFCAQ